MGRCAIAHNEHNINVDLGGQTANSIDFTVTTASVDGFTFNLATGVIAPVRPTCKSIFLIKVVAFSDENFRATAHLGFFPTDPSLV